MTNGLEGPFQNRVISLTDEGHYGPLLEDAGIPVTCLNMSPGRPTPSAARRLMEACSRMKSDILQGWMIHGNLAATFARRFSNRDAALAWNIRVTVEAYNETKASTWALTRLASWLSHRPEAIIYNAHRSQQQYQAIGYSSKRGEYLPNGFDIDKWRPDRTLRRSIRDTLGLSDEDQVIGFVGRAHLQKDIPTLYAAFDMIMEKHPKARLVMLGRDIQPHSKNNERIALLGERSDVADLMRSFDLLCLSSRFEGFPNVIGEAMATGLACVSTDAGDAKEIIGNTGWIAPIRSPEKLAQCLDQALSYEPLELQERGRRARERIVEYYSISSVVEKYSSLYHSILERTV